MSKLQAFLSKYSITTHTIATAWVFAVAAYAAVPAFHSLVQTVYSKLPTWLDQAVIAGLSLAAFYKNWQKAAGGQ